MAEGESNTHSEQLPRTSVRSRSSNSRSHTKTKQDSAKNPNIFVTFIREIFGYRKTSLTLFVILTVVATLSISALDNSLDYTVRLPTDKSEKVILQESWLDLQKLGQFQHPYESQGNDYVHDYLERRVKGHIAKNATFIDYDNDLNYTNKILFNTETPGHNAVTYYESNNLLVRINGTNKDLPALLVSAHYDSVPSSYGITDDGMGIASLMGILNHYATVSAQQPMRTVILNFNNNEEFGLFGATSFLSHPWFEQVKYFLNLEGTGAGGKAVLFRGTDYGIVKYFKGVRYPFGTSLFQQGFNNRLIHSETDYKVYKEKGGLRGLDLAFYKPRDLYHTAGDNIKNINIKSLWHMLSNSLDFVGIISSQKIDLDDEFTDFEPSTPQSSNDFPIFTSFFNWFFVLPVSQLVVFNIVTLVVMPLISIPFLFIIFSYKKNWRIGFVNAIKYPLSLGLSYYAMHFVTNNVIVPINEFLPNSSYGIILTGLSALFLFLNYLILNGINLLCSKYKGVNHDEKLIVIIQTSFFYWILLIASTTKLANNKIGDDHTGEFPLVVIFLLQSLGALFGLVGWSFRSSEDNLHDVTGDDAQPLLSQNRDNNYGSNDNEHTGTDQDQHSSSSESMNSADTSSKFSKSLRKTFSYDWSLQYLIIVPISTLVIYNSGSLLLSGLNKSIQESLKVEKLIFNLIQATAIALVLPFLPFVFKLNRIMVLVLVVVLVQGFLGIFLTNAFDQLNPLKLRFIQSIDLNSPSSGSVVNTFGREKSHMEDVLNDLPSVKESKESIKCTSLADGMQACSYKSILAPIISPDITNFDDFLQVQVLRNSSSDMNHPYGLLSGEIKIRAPKNRMCRLGFNNTQTMSSAHSLKQSPLTTVFVYQDIKHDNDSNNSLSDIGFDLSSIPEGSSRDKNGNYIFKNLNGIDQLELNKLSWDKPYHIGFQWMPKFVDVTDNIESKYDHLNDLGISLECFWADLYEGKGNGNKIPAYDEVLHYSPNYISWSNKESGLVSVSKYIEI